MNPSMQTWWLANFDHLQLETYYIIEIFVSEFLTLMA